MKVGFLDETTELLPDPKIKWIKFSSGNHSEYKNKKFTFGTKLCHFIVHYSQKLYQQKKTAFYSSVDLVHLFVGSRKNRRFILPVFYSSV